MNQEIASRALAKSGFLVPERDRQTDRERPSLGGWAPTAVSPRTLLSAHTSVLRETGRAGRQEAASGKCAVVCRTDRQQTMGQD